MNLHSPCALISPRRVRQLLIASVVAALQAGAAHAENLTVGSGNLVTIGGRTGTTITGFSGFTQLGDATITPTQAVLTHNNIGEASATWSSASQALNNLDGFTATFTYTAGGNKLADGTTFTIQNDSFGNSALGNGGGGLGYENIHNSLSYQIDIWPAVANGVGSTVNTNGLTSANGGHPYDPTGTVDFASGHAIAVTLNYVNGTLVESLVDTTDTSKVYANSYAVDLHTNLGDDFGFVGFTGGTGAATSIQTISDFSFSTNAINEDSLTTETLTIEEGGRVTGLGGSLNANSIQVNGGALALAGTTVNFNNFTQTGGNVGLSDIAVGAGHFYAVQAGTNSLANLAIDAGGTVMITGGTVNTSTFSNAGLFVLNGGTFTTSTIDAAGSAIIKNGTFNLTGQNLEIGVDGPFGDAFVVGPNLAFNVTQQAHIAPDARLMIFGGGKFSSYNMYNECRISVIDGEFTVIGGSSNASGGILDGIRSYITFGSGEFDRFTNDGAINLVDSIVYGDLHNTGFGRLHTAGLVVFNGIVTSDTPIEVSNAIEFAAANNSLTNVTGNATMLIHPGASVTSDGIRVNSLVVKGSQTIRPNTGGNSILDGVSKVSALTLDGSPGNWTGKLDLTNNALILDTTGGTDKTSKIVTLLNQIAQARNGGAWNGAAGITSASVAANATASQQTIGLALVDNADAHLTTYRGQTVDANSLIIVQAHLGDATLDNKVDAFDLNAIATHWQQSAGVLWSSGDFTGPNGYPDGKVDAFDLNALALYWQLGAGGGLSPTLATPSSPVPEPASLAMLALAAPLLLRRRTR